MIIPSNKLNKYKKKVVMVDGGFDPIHSGHIQYFEEAKKLGFPVLCNTQSDDYIIKIKKRNPILPEQQRAKVLDALENIDYVHICNTSTHDVLERLKPLKYIKGADWKTKNLPEIEKKICKKNKTEIIYLDTILDSSTNIINNYLTNSCNHFVNGIIDDFEKFILNQREFTPAYYDDHYFQDQWREEGETYSIEKRREIEGKNPINIKNIFKPKKVLDVGCGPGALMLFLHELGLDTYGIDFSHAAKKAAPPEVKNNIHIGPVTEYHDFGVNFDLVICRETLEHLTVLQVKKTVEVLTKYTNKFLYITTRFHPNPKTLLDITDQPEVDPSHITLLNKKLLRALFVLEGLKTRKDLEEKMDWKNYGRVLTFEKN